MKKSLSQAIVNQLLDVAHDMESYVNENQKWIDDAVDKNRMSITNFLHYLSLRSHDIRSFQDVLHRKRAFLTFGVGIAFVTAGTKSTEAFRA